MLRDGDKAKLLSRRAAILAGGKVFLATTLVGRMYYLQVLEADRYRMLADENRISLRLIPPPRGLILDRFGQALASNKQNFRCLIVQERTENLPSTLEALSTILPLSKAERRRIIQKVEQKRSFVPVTVRENLSWAEMARIQVNAPSLPGVIIDEGLTRHYPHKETAAHTVGYVAPVPQMGLKESDPLLELPGARVGMAGIEKVYDLALRGESGTRRVEVNAVGRVIRELERHEGTPGKEIVLTLDMRLQNMVTERLKGKSAAAVVMDIHNGELLAMASTPGFDPNSFNHGLSSEEWHDLVSNPRSPLTDKTRLGQYSPGSTFKMVVALAALEAGVISPSEKVLCEGYIELGDQRFHCWKEDGHGEVPLVDAIQNSCDIYFYEIAKRTGIDRIAAMAKRFGLGTPTGIVLPNEKSGIIPSRAWKKEEIGTSWQQGETLISGIGQGYVLSTPIQLALMTSRIANGGLAIFPKLILREGEEEKVTESNAKKIDVSRAHLNLVQKGMYQVVNMPGGTAFGSRFSFHGQKMAGKTGTTQVRRISLIERAAGIKDQKDLPWKYRNHALFVGYGPVDSPRYATSVVVEHGGSGSRAAAPVARDILKKTFELDPCRQRLFFLEKMPEEER